jgi:hypothetical protein
VLVVEVEDEDVEVEPYAEVLTVVEVEDENVEVELGTEVLTVVEVEDEEVEVGLGAEVLTVVEIVLAVEIATTLTSLTDGVAITPLC